MVVLEAGHVVDGEGMGGFVGDDGWHVVGGGVVAVWEAGWVDWVGELSHGWWESILGWVVVA